jgi:hypothetical protein
MKQRTRGTISLALGLVSVCLTLAVWAYIIFGEKRGDFHDQGGMVITFMLFPLTFLGWVVGGIGAIVFGTWATRAEGDEGRVSATVGIVLGVLGLLLSLGTCIAPQMLAPVFLGR